MPVDTEVGERQTVEELLAATHTDALLVIKNEKIIAEHYFNGMAAHQRHLLNSVTKSFVGMLAGIAVARGHMNVHDVVKDHVPALADSVWASATIRQLLDMNASVAYDEVYDEPGSGFCEESALVGWRPAMPGDRHCGSLIDFAGALEAAEPAHGEEYCYRTVCTNVLGMVVEQAMRRPLTVLLHEELWQRMRAESDAAVVIDEVGFPYVGAGLNTSARDLACFGLMLVNHGAIDGQQVIPADWIADTLRGDNDCKARFQSGKYGELMPGWHYRNQCWIPALGRDVILGLGIHGQALFADLTTNTVIVKFSSQPAAEIPEMHLAGVAAMDAISIHLQT